MALRNQDKQKEEKNEKKKNSTITTTLLDSFVALEYLLGIFLLLFLSLYIHSQSLFPSLQLTAEQQFYR